MGAQRAVAFAALDLASGADAQDRFGSTINDVVLAVCSGALRAHLPAHGQDTEARWWRSCRSRCAATRGRTPPGNHLSAMFVPLSNDKKTPLERLRTVTAASAAGKGQERAVGYGPMATRLTEAVPPALVKPMVQLGVRSGVLRRLRPGNLMISNVPGPDFPLYFAGMELRAVYPLGPVIDGVALNITVQSYCGSLFVGINASARRRARPAGPDAGDGGRAVAPVPDGGGGGGARNGPPGPGWPPDRTRCRRPGAIRRMGTPTRL